MTTQETWAALGKKAQIEHLEKGLPAPDSAGIFGLSVSEDESELMLIPVPWEATTSYGGGTSQTPDRIIQASHQLDLFDLDFGEPFKSGIGYSQFGKDFELKNKEAKDFVDSARVKQDSGAEPHEIEEVKKVNEASNELNKLVYEEAKRLLSKNKKVGLVGGDHSTPYGLIKALSEKYNSFGILHIDAHFDFRKAYEGFTNSHASIMYNIMNDFNNVSHIYQIGIRDFSKQEYEFQKSLGDRALVHFSKTVFEKLSEPGGAKNIFKEINEYLPENIYISFDIDGLDPKLCPGTGTPVPGGLDFEFTCSLLASLKAAGKNIVGFDLVEVASPDGEEWDLNVGARMLYKLCGLTLSDK